MIVRNTTEWTIMVAELIQRSISSNKTHTNQKPYPVASFTSNFKYKMKEKADKARRNLNISLVLHIFLLTWGMCSPIQINRWVWDKTE